MLLRSIRSRLLGLVFATVVPFIALIGVGLWTQWQSDQAAALRRAVDEARSLATEVDDYIGHVDFLLTGLSRAVSTNPADRTANDAILRKVKGELPGYLANILIFSLDGTNIGNSNPGRTRPNARERSYFQRALAGDRLAIGDVIRPAFSGRWVVTIARRVEDQEGQLRGVLAIGLRLEEFENALPVRDLPPGSVATIVNERGIVVARTQDGPNWIGRELGQRYQIAQHLAEDRVSEIVTWADGVDRITGSATAHMVPWLVSVGLPSDLAFAAVASRLSWGALFILATLMAAFAIAWMLSGRIVRPLQQLGKDAAVLASGELSHRTAVRTQDEVGTLANNFNQMAQALDHRQEEARAAATELRQAKDTLGAVIDASPVAIVCSDPNRNIVLWNRGAEQMFGYAAQEVLGQPTKLVPPAGRAESAGLFARAYKGETLRDISLKRMRKDGFVLDVRAAAAPMYNPDGSVRSVAWAYEDVTDRKKAEEQLRRLAHYDQLTGLPNRLSLQKELGRLLADRQRGPTSVALFDLDGFKDVNDTLGHSTGDELLIEVAHRLVQVAESCAQVRHICRLGGDEFVVIIPDCGDPRPVAEIVDVILKRLAEPFNINDHTLHLAASAGIAISPNDGATVDELLANADLALYRAKSEGGRSYRFFLPVFRAQAHARQGLSLELRRAFAENEFEIYFQPQVRLIDGAVVGAEALLRWRHPVRGILGPGAFIEALGESSIAHEVGRWIILTACQRTAAWRAKGLPLNRIGVNLFPAQADDERILQDVDDALRDSGLPIEALELEITENAAFNYEDPSSPLQKLHKKGVKLTFDDFGTGYASLNYLTRFPVWRIKIDRSFVGRITESTEDAAIVRSLIAMAHNLGLKVIAEGVETSAQAAFLLAEGCEEAQGFLYAKPLPADDLEMYLKTRRLAPDAEDAVDTSAGRNLQRHATKSLARRRFRKA
jgi:diguanylate cyclase (GGDEF)-like protein/PAS domain S-box-containing protein